jgi:hypothetical protein
LQQRTSLFNHFLGAAEQREWESDARAIAFAMPLLQKADRVTVLTVIGGTEVSGPPLNNWSETCGATGLVPS